MPIPVPDLDELNPDNNIPEKEAAAIVAALLAFEDTRKKTLVQGASRAYLRGETVAHKRLLTPLVPEEIKDDVYSFLKTYKGQLDNGYTVIQGEKKYWLKNRTMQERKQIFDIISKGITEGKSPAVVRKEFQKYMGMQKSQAETIARTETAYVQCQGRDGRYKKSGVERVKWLCGPAPCEICAKLEGEIFTWDTLPYQQPVHPRCFLPGTRYKSPGGVVAGLRAWYDGQAVELTISGGSNVSVTSNHMFLTPFGFAGADQLRKGDNIIYCPDFEGVITDDPDNNQMPASVEDIFSSLLESGGVSSVSVPVSPEDLHGDGEVVKGNIDIIRPDSFLRGADEPGIIEPGHTQPLYPRNIAGSFDASGPLAELLKRLAFAADCGMSRGRAPAPSFSRQLPHVDTHRLRQTASTNSGLLEPLINSPAGSVEDFSELVSGGSGLVKTYEPAGVDMHTLNHDPGLIKAATDSSFPDVKTLCELLNLHSGVIELREIIGVKVIPYHGYVYDFETLSTLCIGNGVISSNCVCDLAPILDPDAKSTPRAAPRPKPKATPKPKPPEKTPDQKIKECEEKIKHRKTEKAYVFDTKGNVLLEKSSNAKDYVEFSKKEIKLLKGNIDTHNHPIGNSFSKQDIAMACSNGCKETRVVGKQGTFIMRMKNGGNLNEKVFREKISASYDLHCDATIKTLREQIKTGKITLDRAELVAEHSMWSKVAKDVPEIEYKFIMDWKPKR